MYNKCPITPKKTAQDRSNSLVGGLCSALTSIYLYRTHFNWSYISKSINSIINKYNRNPFSDVWGIA